jgi:radical SAM protein with 4Fe4S-binding SPASM domain
LTTENALAVVQQLREYKASQVSLSGGEVLLRKDIEAILEALVSFRISFMVETNGILITDTVITIFKRALEQGVPACVGISLDGGTKEAHEWNRGYNTFYPALKGIEKAHKAGIKFAMQCVLNWHNIDSIPEFFKLAERFGSPQLNFVFVNSIGRGQQNFGALGIPFGEYPRVFDLIHACISRYKSTICLCVPPSVIQPRLLPSLLKSGKIKLATTCSFPLLGVLPDGTISICALTAKDENLHLGNIKTDSLQDIWESAKIRQLRKTYEQGVLMGICSDCVFNHTCKGGCRAFAYQEGGSFTSPHPICHSFFKHGRFPKIYKQRVLASKAET